MVGFIKDHRKELDSDVWSMPPLYHRLWQWLKYNVNHEDNTIPMRDGSHMTIKRGQRLTSVRDIAKGISWYEGTKYKEPNPKTISTILEWMEKTIMISIDRGQGNRQYTLITLIKYEEYQEKNIQGNSKVTVKKQSADINKNDKEHKNEKELKTLYASNVSLTVEEHARLVTEYGEEMTRQSIEYLSSYKIEKAYTTKSDNLTIRRWVMKAIREGKGKSTVGKTQIAAHHKEPVNRYTEREVPLYVRQASGNDSN